jgi:hypothetical protein
MKIFMQTSNYIAFLPKEIVQEIFVYLNAEDLLKSKTTDSATKNIIEDNDFVQRYIINHYDPLLYGFVNWKQGISSLFIERKLNNNLSLFFLLERLKPVPVLFFNNNQVVINILPDDSLKTICITCLKYIKQPTPGLICFVFDCNCYTVDIYFENALSNTTVDVWNIQDQTLTQITHNINTPIKDVYITQKQNDQEKSFENASLFDKLKFIDIQIAN